nr:hypothetical protein [Corynebacterium xerosis]
MTARTSRSALTRSTLATIASMTSGEEIGLRISGRLIVHVSTCPSRSTSSTSWVMVPPRSSTSTGIAPLR